MQTGVLIELCTRTFVLYHLLFGPGLGEQERKGDLLSCCWTGNCE